MEAWVSGEMIPPSRNSAYGSPLARIAASASTLSWPYWSIGFTGVSGVIRSGWR